MILRGEGRPGRYESCQPALRNKHITDGRQPAGRATVLSHSSEVGRRKSEQAPTGVKGSARRPFGPKRGEKDRYPFYLFYLTLTSFCKMSFSRVPSSSRLGFPFPLPDHGAYPKNWARDRLPAHFARSKGDLVVGGEDEFGRGGAISPGLGRHQLRSFRSLRNSSTIKPGILAKAKRTCSSVTDSSACASR